MVDIQKYLEERFGGIKEMNERDINMLLSAAHIETYKKNSIVWRHKSTKQTGVLIILDGILKARYYTETSSVFLYYLKSGDVSMLASPSLIGNINTHIELIAKEDVNVIRIEEDVYSSLETKYPNLLLSTDYYLAKSLEKLTIMIRERLHATVEKNVARYLLDHKEAYDSTTIHISHQELAENIGTKREVVSRTLYKLCTRNILSLSRNQIEILNLEKLKECSQK